MAITAGPVRLVVLVVVVVVVVVMVTAYILCDGDESGAAVMAVIFLQVAGRGGDCWKVGLVLHR